MESLTIDQRVAKIQELAGNEISVAANLIVTNTGLKAPLGKRALFVNNHFQESSISDEPNEDFEIPTDTAKYDIKETEHGTSWKLKDEN